ELLGLVKRRTLLLHLGRVFRAQGIMLELTKIMPLDVQPVKQPYLSLHHPTNVTSLSTLPLGSHSSSNSNSYNRRKEKEREKARMKTLHNSGLSPEETAKRLEALLASPVDLRKAPDISVDPSAFRVSELTPLSDVYALFDLIRCNRVFVVSYGVLVGVISRRILITNITHLNQEPNPGNPSLLFAMGRSTSSLPTPPSSFRARSRRGSGATASLRQRSRQNSLSTSGSSLPTGPSSTSSSASPFSARSSSNGRLQSWVRYRLFGAGKKEGKKAKNAREDQEEEQQQQQQQQLDEK
ncbi:hypothetical protein VYU27_009973, partial [Nannochloropsis oceanica]